MRRLLLLAACILAAPAGCGGGDEGGGATTFEITAEPGAEQSVPTELGGDLGSEEAVAAERTAERYVEAIDERDAAAVCELLVPGALREVRGVSGPCEEALENAIGRPAKGGAPVWRGTRIIRPRTIAVDDDSARITLEVFHRFSDRRNLSAEDDLIYLERDGDRWLVSQASATLYRAIGYPEPPLAAYRPPGG